MNSVHYINGVLAWTYTDHGDGTGIRTCYDTDGKVTSVEQLTGLPIPEPVIETAIDKLSQLPPEQAEAVMSLGLGLIDKAGDLYSALTKMSASNTARPAIDLITDAVLTAALPLLAEDTP